MFLMGANAMRQPRWEPQSKAAQSSSSAACNCSALIELTVSLYTLSPYINQPPLKWGEQKDTVERRSEEVVFKGLSSVKVT